MLGAYVVKSPKYANTFNVSAGSMCHEARKERWVDRESDMGKIVRFKYLPHGMKDVPRHPLFAGFRDEDDMS
jgi:DNA ligase-1